MSISYLLELKDSNFLFFYIFLYCFYRLSNVQHFKMHKQNYFSVNQNGSCYLSLFSEMIHIIQLKFFSSGYCISSVLVGSLYFDYQLKFRVTLYGIELRQQLEAKSFLLKIMKISQTIIPFAHVGYEIGGYSRPSVTRLVG